MNRTGSGSFNRQFFTTLAKDADALKSLARSTLPEHVRLAWGKMRRFWYARFGQAHIAGNLERRRGECARCGACCRLMLRCPMLAERNGVTKCIAHDDRPDNCRIFPVDEADLADRNIVMPGRACGFHFIARSRGSKTVSASEGSPTREGNGPA